MSPGAAMDADLWPWLSMRDCNADRQVNDLAILPFVVCGDPSQTDRASAAIIYTGHVGR